MALQAPTCCNFTNYMNLEALAANTTNGSYRSCTCWKPRRSCDALPTRNRVTDKYGLSSHLSRTMALRRKQRKIKIEHGICLPLHGQIHAMVPTHRRLMQPTLAKGLE